MLNGLILGFFIFTFVFIWHKVFNLFKFIASHKRHQTSKYEGWRKFAVKLVPDLLIGLSMAWCLHFFHDTPWLRDTEDASMDFAMKILKNFISYKSPEFALLDIDEKTYKIWGEPPFTPRDRVVNLIDIAVKGGAKLVIVDVDLSQKTPIEGLDLPNGLKMHPFDQKMYDYLSKYNDKEGGFCVGTKCPPIILARTFHALPEQETEGVWERLCNILEPVPDNVYEPRIGFLEEAVKNSSKYVQWASPLYLLSSSDNALRRWSLWQPTCVEGQPDVIPSVQLLAATLLTCNSGSLEDANNVINKNLVGFAPQRCPSTHYIPQELANPILFCETANGDKLEIDKGERGGIRQRIVFKMDWRPPENPESKWMRYQISGKDKSDGTYKFILTVYSAQPYLDEITQTGSSSPLNDKVVIIGGSYSEARDIYATPLGRMPGGLILINAIDSLLRYGEIQSLPEWAKWVVEVVLIVLASLIFTFVGSSFWKVTVAGMLTLSILIPLSIFVLSLGIWMDFSLPLLAVLFHHIASEFHEKSDEVHEKLGEIQRLRQQLETTQQQEDRMRQVSQQGEQMMVGLKELGDQMRLTVSDLKGFNEQSCRMVVDLKNTSEQAHQMVVGLKNLGEQTR